jgi:hypothetical protein
MTLTAQMIIDAKRPAMRAAMDYLLRRTRRRISLPAVPGIPARYGAPPRFRTGKLYRSGRAFVKRDGTGVVEFSVAYAASLEYSRRHPHPFLHPTLTDERRNILRILRTK